MAVIAQNRSQKTAQIHYCKYSHLAPQIAHNLPSLANFSQPKTRTAYCRRRHHSQPFIIPSFRKLN